MSVVKYCVNKIEFHHFQGCVAWKKHTYKSNTGSFAGSAGSTGMAAAAIVVLMESRVVFTLEAHCVDWQTERPLRDAIDRVVGGATEKAHTDDGAISAHATPMTTAIRDPAILPIWEDVHWNVVGNAEVGKTQRTTTSHAYASYKPITYR
eukprot:scaffold34938_cov53-Attheya_sp.AAC.2